MSDKPFIPPASGKLGVLLPGMGAVATTFMAGVEAVRRGIAQPIGSVSQLAHIRLGKRTENRNPLISEIVPLAKLEDLVFGGWDPIPDNALVAARKAGVLHDKHIDAIADFLEGIKPIMADDTGALDQGLGEDVMEKGLANSVKDNDMRFPPDWRLSFGGRSKP